MAEMQLQATIVSTLPSWYLVKNDTIEINWNWNDWNEHTQISHYVRLQCCLSFSYFARGCKQVAWCIFEASLLHLGLGSAMLCCCRGNAWQVALALHATARAESSDVFYCSFLSHFRQCTVGCCADFCLCLVDVGMSQSFLEKNQTWGDSIALSACEAGNQWVLALQLFEFMKATNDVCFWAENYLV